MSAWQVSTMTPKSIILYLILVGAIHYSGALYQWFPIEPLLPQGPVVHVKNGSYLGIYSESFGQDFFLGIPYAQSPIHSRRFSPPVSNDKKWKGLRKALEYGPAVCLCSRRIITALANVTDIYILSSASAMGYDILLRSPCVTFSWLVVRVRSVCHVRRLLDAQYHPT